MSLQSQYIYIRNKVKQEKIFNRLLGKCYTTLIEGLVEGHLYCQKSIKVFTLCIKKTHHMWICRPWPWNRGIAGPRIETDRHPTPSFHLIKVVDKIAQNASCILRFSTVLVATVTIVNNHDMTVTKSNNLDL